MNSPARDSRCRRLNFVIKDDFSRARFGQLLYWTCNSIALVLALGISAWAMRTGAYKASGAVLLVYIVAGAFWVFGQAALFLLAGK